MEFKHLKQLSFFVILCSIILSVSCSKIANESESINIQKNEYKDAKEAFLKLDHSIQIDFWIKRFNTVYYSQKGVFDADALLLLKSLINILETNKTQVFYDSNLKLRLLDLSEDLLDHFSKEEFYLLFCDISDGYRKLKKTMTKAYCDDCKSAIVTERAILLNNNIQSRGVDDPIHICCPPEDDCNCDWGWCGNLDITCRKVRCQDTNFGCGLILAFGCHSSCDISL